MQTIEERIHSYEPFFGRWRLNDPPVVLGRGNSGIVYLVESDGMTAALKVISIPKDDKDLQAMLDANGGSMEKVRQQIQQELRYARTEIEIMERLRADSHIVCFEDAQIIPREDTFGFDVLIRMERLVRLDAFLKNPEKYGIRKGNGMILRIWSELVSGLSFCERSGVVHLDIKPENIFYAEPSRDYFKLGDFGVSIRSENGKGVSKGMIVGTYDYMAPEVFAGKGGDIRSDMYSLAIVMYELFNNGKLPFMNGISRPSQADFIAAWTRRLKKKEDVPPIKGLDPRLSAILMKCLNQDPTQRYATMKDLYVDLQRYILEMEPKAKERGPRPKWVPIVAGVAVAGILGAMVYMGVRLSSNEKEPEFAPAFTTAEGRFNSETECTYTGSAKPGQMVALYLKDVKAPGTAGDSPYLESPAQKDGSWSATVNKGDLVDGTEYRVEIRVDGKSYLSDTFTYDDSAMLVVNGDNAIESGKPITGLTEGGATITLLVDGQPAARTTADANGAYSLDMLDDLIDKGNDIAISMDQTYVLQTVDAAGNRREVTLNPNPVAVPVVYLPIRVSGMEGAEALEDGRYVINAKSGATHTLTLSCQANAAIQVQEAGDTGEPNLIFTTEDGSASIPLDYAEGEHALTISYYGRDDMAVSIALLVDRHAPSIESLEPPTALEPAALEVRTEASAAIIVLDESGDAVAEGMADEAGLCVLPERAYAYEAHTVRATDPAGNVSERTFTPAIRLKAGGVNTGSAAIAVHTVPGATVSVKGSGLDVSVEADAEGECTVPFESAPVLGDTYAIQAAVGDETQSLEITVERLKFETRITLVISPLSEDNRVAGDMIVSGTAQADAKLTALWNDAEAGQTQADDQGNYQFQLNARDSGLPASGEMGAITVIYTEGEAGEPTAMSSAVMWDGYTELTLDAVDQDSAGLSGTAEPGARLTIARNGETVGSQAAGDDGSFLWTSGEAGFVLGDVYTVSAEDDLGNQAQQTVAVDAAVRAAIDVQSIAMKDMAMTVQGFAQPGKAVDAAWNDVILSGTQANDDGSFTLILDAEACGIPARGAEGSLRLTYADGISPDSAYDSGAIFWDAFADLSVDDVSEDDDSLTIHTDPGATVEIRMDGAVLATLEADTGTGEVTWPVDMDRHTEGATYTVYAVDPAGNDASADTVVQVSAYAQIEVAIDASEDDWLYDEGGRDVFGLSAMCLAGTAQPNAEIRVRLSDGSEATARADANGAFEVLLDAEKLEVPLDGAEYRFSFSYADGKGRSRGAELGPVWWDWGTYMSLEELHEDDASLVISVEPGAVVEVLKDGAAIARMESADGSLTWTPEESFVEGESYTVRATDAFGFTAEAEVTVEEAQREAITASVDNLSANWTLKDADMRIAGRAQADTDVEALWNGEPAATAHVNGDGSYEMTLSASACGIPAEGLRAELTVRYADGKGRKLASSQFFTWDSHAEVARDGAFAEDSGGLGIQTDPNTKVQVKLGEGITPETNISRLYNYTADASGTCFVPMEPAALVKGYVYDVTVTDALGNTASQSFEVAETSRAAITARISGLQGDSWTSEMVVVSGTAEPGATMCVALGDLRWDNVAVDDDGAYSLIVTATACGIPAEGRRAAFDVWYADGVGLLSGSRLAGTPEFLWDCTPPGLQVDKADSLDTRATAVTGWTDGAAVEVYLNGAPVKTALDGSGGFATEGKLDFAEGDLVRVISRDAAGNANEREITIIGAAAWQIGSISLQGDSFLSTDNILVGGWYACHGREIDNVYLSVEQNGAAVPGVNVAITPVAMDDSALASRTSAWGSPADVTQGRTFTASLPLDGMEGEYALRLKTFDPAEGAIVIAEARISVEAVQAESAEAEVVSDFAVNLESETPYAVGFDVPSGAFDGGEQLLTGWFYGSEEARDYRIDGVVIYDIYGSSVTGGRNGVRLDEVSIDDMPTQGVAYVVRDTADVPAEAKQQLSGVTAYSGRAGFVIYLNGLNLPDGKYTAVLKTAVDGAPTEAGSISITVQSGAAQPVTPAQVKQATMGWAPAEPQGEAIG